MLLQALLLVMCMPTHGHLITKSCLSSEFFSWRGVISHHEAKQLLVHKSATSLSPSRITSSIDLGKSTSELLLNEEGVSVINNDKTNSLLATWDEITDIADRQRGCHAVFDDGSKPYYISTLSANTGNPASLCPPLEGPGAPTMILGNFAMHRLVNVNPMADTKHKISAVANSLFQGCQVLDTCCGLGYTAIEAAGKVGKNGKVTTIEYDEASLEMCAYNPWSSQLFSGELPIEIRQGDSCNLVKSIASNSINVIIHDPPARALCRSDLYGLEFYKDLRRVLTSNGIMFHYIGNPDSKESGRLYSGITKRLLEAGFRSVKPFPKAFGLVATGIVQE